MASSDTIFALSTGRLPTGVAIIRMSGPHVRFVLEMMCGEAPPPRIARYVPIRYEQRELDRGLALFFPGPSSVTGEDCGELHVHGSVAVVKAVLTSLGSMEGMKPAEPGDFTKRGFLNGKMDLTGVEALSDLIAAETEQQRILAISNFSGRQRDIYLGWRERILRLRAGLEAELDFSDQEDVQESQLDLLSKSAAALASEITAHVARYGEAEIVRSGFSVVIVGAPNAGKSSLLNALAQRDAAIVSDEAGTTRDLITVSLDIGGFKVNVTDTAGFNANPGNVEAMGIERAREAASNADLVIHLIDLSDPKPIDLQSSREVLLVGSKSDLISDSRDLPDLSISTRSDEGLDRLIAEISSALSRSIDVGGIVVPTRERHVRHLNATISSLQRVGAVSLPELAAEELRVAAGELGRIVGLSDTEELLGEIFSRFCIGK